MACEVITDDLLKSNELYSLFPLLSATHYILLSCEQQAIINLLNVYEISQTSLFACLLLLLIFLVWGKNVCFKYFGNYIFTIIGIFTREGDGRWVNPPFV